MMKHKLFKLGAVAAITVSGIGAVSSLKTVNASTYKTAIKRIKIKYLPGKGLRIWTNYNSGRFLGFRAKDGTEWNVVKTALDKQGNLWYMVGENEWIPARYTEDVETTSTAYQSSNKDKETDPAKKSKISTLAQKAKATVKKVANKPANKTAKITAAQKKQEKAQAATEKKQDNIVKAKKIVAQTIQKTSASSQAPSKTGAIVALAKEQLGKPYVWGAVGPDSFDCSGLVQFVYAHAAGISMPRVTTDQVKVGQTVSMNNLQPGDLLFWGSANAPYHVAIYVGNNQYVNAATPDQGTILQTISSYYYPSIAKRVL